MKLAKEMGWSVVADVGEGEGEGEGEGVGRK